MKQTFFFKRRKIIITYYIFRKCEIPYLASLGFGFCVLVLAVVVVALVVRATRARARRKSPKNFMIVKT